MHNSGFEAAGAWNYLPYDGLVSYTGDFLTGAEADDYFAELETGIAWQHDEVTIFGKRLLTRRKVAWYGDRQFGYRYSGHLKVALPWTPDLLELREHLQQFTGQTFNSCLLNLYHTGEEGMGWHSDAEKELLENGAIASVSLGAGRKFMFRHRETKETVTLLLEHGSLLLMEGDTQKHWLHRLPPAKRITQPRINLTFRTIRDNGSF
jgi:alkylated DNA repair dioxygenase AlkB